MTLSRFDIPHRDLHSTLVALLRSDAPPNPALNRLISDYARYHAVLAILAAGFLLSSVALAVFFWRRSRRAGKGGRQPGAFERRLFVWFAALAVLVSLFLVLVFVANVSNARAPRTGLAGSLAMLREPPADAPTRSRYEAYETWLESGTSKVPPAVQQHVDARLRWQRPKAVVCAIALAGMAFAATRFWRTMIRRSRARPWARRRDDIIGMTAGIGSVLACLVLMLMVMGNTQAAIAPLSMTMFFG